MTQEKPQNAYISVIAYLTIIGWIVALVLYNSNEENKNDFNAFHLRQAGGIMLLSVILSFAAIIPILGQLLFLVGGIYNFICWIIGFISAIQGTQKPVPLLGDKYQEWLKSIA